MRAGQLRHRVELHSNSPAGNDYGEQIESWSSYTTVWAAIEPLSGRELLNAQQISAEITTRVRIRYNSSVTSEHRVVIGGRTLEIVSVINPAERDITQHLLCKEVT